MPRITIILTVLSTILLAGCHCPKTDERGTSVFHLAQNGKTTYQIVTPKNPIPGTSLAADTLAKNLKLKTGADFDVVTEMKDGVDHIFVGIAPKSNGSTTTDPANLEEDEYVTLSEDGDVYLYGEGPHGAFNAVMDFLETRLAWRWFDYYDEPIIPPAKTVTLEEFSKKGGFIFPYRIKSASRDFYFFHGANMGYTEWNEKALKKYGKPLFDTRIQSKKITPVFVHSCYGYIPPDPKRQTHKVALNWVPNKNFLKTHPEFFALRKNGTRNPYLHLCWSNKDMRGVFSLLLEEQLKRSGPNCVLVIDTGDDANRGPTCRCEACQALAKKYGTLAGPHLDYVFDVAKLFAEKHPEAIIRTEINRLDPGKEYTYKIPILPDGMSFPDNINLFLANKGYINRPIDHPDNGNFYDALKRARELTPNISLWSYPHPFFQIDLMPFTSLRLQVENFKKIKDFVTTHFDETGFFMYSFNGLETYVITKLWKNPDADVDKLIKEYTEGRYHAAAEDVRTYQADLEDACVNWKHPMNYSYSAPDFKKEFAYLTPERMLRWQKLFDGMMRKTKGDVFAQKNLGHLRISLDAATLARWHALVRFDRNYFKDAKLVHDRLESNRTRQWHPCSKTHKNMIDEWMFIIDIGDNVKPLPAKFANLPEGDVIRVVPVNHAKKPATPKIVKDDAAAFGYAATIDKPDLPFHFGFYQFDFKAVTLRKTIEKGDIQKPGEYTIFKLGDIAFSPDCMLWFSSKSWATHARLGGYYDLNLTTQKWTAYVSLKFPKNFTGKDEDKVLCDQIVLVKQNESPETP